MKINQIKVGMVLSYLKMALGVLIGLIYTPVMIRLLGKSEYGLYNTVASTISMLSVLSLGFNSGYIRFFAKYKKENDIESIGKLNGIFLTIFIIIGLVALFCGIYLSGNLRLVFDYGLTFNEYQVAKILMILLSVNLSVSFPMSVFSNIISANEKFIFLKIIDLFKTIISPLVTLPLLLMGFKSIGMVVTTLSINLVIDSLYIYYVLVVLKNRFIFHSFNIEVFKELFTYTSFVAINIIVDQINWNVDKMLLARYKGTASVAVYSVGYTLFSYYMMFSTSVSGLFTPRVHKMISNCDDQHKLRMNLSELFIKVGRIQFLILGLISTGLIFFGKSFITKYWAGSDYSESYFVLVLLIISSTIALMQNLGIEIQRALNKHKFRSMVYFLMAIANFVASIFLCQFYGAIGSALGTAISLILCNGLIMNYYYMEHCFIDIASFWKNIIGMLKGFVLPILLGIFFLKIGNSNSLLYYCFQIVVYAVIYCCSVWFLSMNQYEKAIFKKILRK